MEGVSPARPIRKGDVHDSHRLAISHHTEQPQETHTEYQPPETKDATTRTRGSLRLVTDLALPTSTPRTRADGPCDPVLERVRARSGG